MLVFYFDTTDGDCSFTDYDGVELESPARAREVAISMLPELALSPRVDADFREIRVFVRDAADQVILTASLAMKAEWKGQPPG